MVYHSNTLPSISFSMCRMPRKCSVKYDHNFYLCKGHSDERYKIADVKAHDRKLCIAITVLRGKGDYAVQLGRYIGL
jgi:hypothetical protein